MGPAPKSSKKGSSGAGPVIQKEDPLYTWIDLQIFKFIEYHPAYTLEMVDELEAERVLTTLVIGKRQYAENKLIEAQVVSVPHSGKDAFDNLMATLGLPSPKTNDLVNAPETDMNDVKRQMQSLLGHTVN